MKASSIVFVNNELDARYLRMAVRRGAGEQRNIGNITEIHSTGLDCETCGGGLLAWSIERVLVPYGLQKERRAILRGKGE